MPMITSRDQSELEGLVTVNIDPEDILRWVSKNYAPDEVFDRAALAGWSADNGYRPAEDF